MADLLRNRIFESLLTEAEGRRIGQAIFAVALAATLCVLAVGLAGEPDAVTGVLLFLPALVLSFWLTRRGFALLPRLLLTTSLYSVITWLLFTGQGIHDLAVTFYAVIVIFAGLLLGRWAALGFAALCTIAALLVVHAEMTGRLVVDYTGITGYTDAATLGVLLFMAAGMLWFVMGSLGRTLRALKEGEAELEAQAQSLRGSEARWRALVASAPGRIVSVDDTGRIALSTSKGSGEGEPSLFDWVAESEHDLLRGALRDALGSRRPTSCEVAAATPGRFWTVHLGPLDGERATAVLLDDTDRHRAEQERARLEEQLRQSQKIEALGQLAGGVAHDLNNLLTVVAGHVAILEENLEDPGDRDGLREIRAAQERAAELTQQLLTFGRRQVVEPQLLDLNAAVEAAAGLLKRLLDERIEVALDLSPEPPTVRADPVQIEQVVLNLALNARDAMSDGGRIALATRSEDGSDGPHGVLSVSDEGHGMDERIQAHMFEPFFTTKPRGHGTGLGLSTVYGIVSQAGGEIAVASRPGGGTRFDVSLPRVDASTERSAPPPLPVESHGGSECLLLAEDDGATRRLLARVLGDFGYRVVTGSDGREALRLGEEAAVVDLLITDLVMPEMNGRELAERLRAARGRLPVLFISGWTDDPIDPTDPANAPCAFLQKPFSPATLTARVRELLDARAESAPG